MLENNTAYLRINEQLPRIWESHRLGSIHSITRPSRGGMNYALIVNDAYVIRFDITGKIPLRFQSEVLAYQYLQKSEVPVPEVIALDQSKQLVPYEYLITSKLAGTSVIDSWNGLSAQARERVAYEAGRYLAMIHSHTFERFGKLRDLPNGGFTCWYDYCADYFHRYANQALAMNIIDTSLRDRMQAVLEKYRPLLDMVKSGSFSRLD
jgi:aminoglycoside phosphotransferase (APT) family kinase protein